VNGADVASHVAAGLILGQDIVIIQLHLLMATIVKEMTQNRLLVMTYHVQVSYIILELSGNFILYTHFNQQLTF
jgi:hypothetical protein